MFDTSFQLSNTYFTALQLFRIFADEIRSATPQIQTLGDWVLKFPEPTHTRSSNGRQAVVDTEASEARKEIWAQIMEKHTIDKELLLERIRKKSDEIISLRDGVCNTRAAFIQAA